MFMLVYFEYISEFWPNLNSPFENLMKVIVIYINAPYANERQALSKYNLEKSSVL